jgi:hypothetical protein
MAEEVEPSLAAALAVPVAKAPPALPDIEVKPEPEAPPDGEVTGPTKPTVEQPEAMLPAAQRKPTRTIQKTKPTRRLQPGDLICGQCGEGNPPARKFCSRCGESLELAEVVKRPWWKKLWPQKKVKTLEAGERPGKAGVKAKKKRGQETMRAVRKVVTTAAIVIVGLVALVPPFRNWSNDTFVQPVKDKWNDFTTQSFEPVNPVGEPLTPNQTPDNPATNAVDNAGNTFWVATPVDPGQQPVVALIFGDESHPVNIDKAIIQNGARDKFANFSRAQKLHLVFNTGKTSDIDLKDAPDQQKVSISNGHGVTSVQIFIVSTYAAIGDPAPPVAISEIEFFTEK